MRRLFVLCLAIVAVPASAQGDPSNPAGAPLSPSLDRQNQPSRDPVPTSTLPAEAQQGTSTGDAADAANAQAELDADAPTKPIAPNRKLDKRERRARPR